MQLPESFVLFVIAAAFTPGPNNIMIMASGLNHGVKASLPHFFGICLGFPFVFFAMGFGLGYMFERFAWLHLSIQVVGVAYLFYLAWLIASAAPANFEEGVEGTKPLRFYEAALFQWVNPKVWVMGTSAIGAFSVIGQPLSGQVLAMGLVFFLMTFPSAGVWLVFGASLKRVLGDPTHQRVFNVVMAGLLVASMLPTINEMLVNYL